MRRTGKYALIEMHERVDQRPLPVVDLVDMRAEFQETGQGEIFSRRCSSETQAALDRGEQAIILLNRRGYSFVVMCRTCGEKIECENCAISLTYHKPVVPRRDDIATQPGQRLNATTAAYVRTVPKHCPKCESEHLYYLGAGSQQGEERLQELFPDARIGRMDRDTVRGRYDMERLLTRLHAGEINLLVGTQMIAKGHDIHGVTLVGVVGADHALGLPDFRAAERVFQLLTQVSGRAGRGELPGKCWSRPTTPTTTPSSSRRQHDFTSLRREGDAVPQVDALPAARGAGQLIIQSQRLEEAAGWAASLGKWFAAMPSRACARARSRERAHLAHQAHLPLPSFAEGRKAAGPGANVARRPDSGRSAGHPAAQSRRRRRRRKPDVVRAGQDSSEEPSFS